VTTTKISTTTTAPVTTTVTTIIGRNSVNINKVDLGGTEVVGARLSLTGKDVNGEDFVFSKDSILVGDGATLINAVGTEMVWL
jgi:hypothetical protein